jgi:hypothetical protein
MAKKGGWRGGGRPKGSKSKTLRGAKLMENLAGRKPPVEWLIDLMHNQRRPFRFRVEAAKALLPYTARKLPEAHEISGPNGGPVRTILVDTGILAPQTTPQPLTPTDPVATIPPV